jgi:putative transposase
MEVEKGGHCKYQIRYHIVWGVKYAHHILIGERPKFLKQIILEIAERYEYLIEAVGTDGNHVHIFAGAHPATSPAKLIQTLKSISAKKMFEQYPKIKKFLWGGALWSIGYYIRTVTDGPLDGVIKMYIEEQGKQTKKGKVCQLKLVP